MSQEWIAVTPATMPPKSETKWCATKVLAVVGMARAVKQLDYREIENPRNPSLVGQWFFYDGNWAYENDEITHWMPLPAPPVAAPPLAPEPQDFSQTKLENRHPRAASASPSSAPPEELGKFVFRCNVGHTFIEQCSPDPPEGIKCHQCNATAVPVEDLNRRATPERKERQGERRTAADRGADLIWRESAINRRSGRDRRQSVGPEENIDDR